MKTKKTVSISLPQIEGVELKNATVDLEKGVVVAEYGEKDIKKDIKKDISEIAVGFKSAADYLHEDPRLSYISTTEKHRLKLDAFSKLLILAEAWNSFDGFKPDWGDSEQDKYYVWFNLGGGDISIWGTAKVCLLLDTHTSHFTFKSPERARQFANKFIELFKIVLTN